MPLGCPRRCAVGVGVLSRSLPSSLRRLAENTGPSLDSNPSAIICRGSVAGDMLGDRRRHEGESPSNREPDAVETSTRRRAVGVDERSPSGSGARPWPTRASVGGAAAAKSAAAREADERAPSVGEKRRASRTKSGDVGSRSTAGSAPPSPTSRRRGSGAVAVVVDRFENRSVLPASSSLSESSEPSVLDREWRFDWRATRPPPLPSNAGDVAESSDSRVCSRSSAFDTFLNDAATEGAPEATRERTSGVVGADGPVPSRTRRQFGVVGADRSANGGGE